MAKPEEKVTDSQSDSSSGEREEEQISIEEDEREEEGSVAEKEPPTNVSKISAVRGKSAGFDWLALGLVILIAAFFSLTARFNSQPSPSYVPAAVLSATGCGLLVTALRKLRTVTGAGLLEATLGGFCLALFQFVIALTYPGVFSTLFSAPDEGHAFLLTWGLIGLFTVVASLAGAALGHLAFAPLRPLPERVTRRKRVADLNLEEEDEEDEDESTEIERSEERLDESSSNPHGEAVLSDLTTRESVEADDNGDVEEEGAEEEEDQGAEEGELVTVGARSPLLGYVITIVLIGLLPMMIGYVFAAAYDYIMGLINANQISPALYPTLSLLSGLLPWRLPAPINLSSGDATFILFTLLWRIPDSFLGNPQMFDVQALEPLLFNGVALAFFLTIMYGRGSDDNKPKAAPWGIFLLLEALLGLILILPPALWIHSGLQGLLQFETLVVQLPAIQLLDPKLLILDLVTAPIFCLLVGVVVRRQYQLWTQPGRRAQEDEEE